MKQFFYKFEGTGNDFILFDDRNKLFPVEDSDHIAKLCDRRLGLGADGLILLQEGDFPVMRYFNADGNESTFCGNGARCFTAWMHILGVLEIGKVFRFLAADGIHRSKIISLEKKHYWVELGMQPVKEIQKKEDFFVLQTGSPHAVVWNEKPCAQSVFDMHVKRIRFGPIYRKEGINVNVTWLDEKKELHMRTYERGVEDETLSCGTGTVAVALLAHHLQGIPSDTPIHTPGGELKVSFHVSDSQYVNILLTGPATFVFKAQWED
jgi:diaminopimelate epimerase